MPRPATQPGDRDFEEICPRVGYHSLIEKPVRAVAARFTRWREATVSEAQPSAQAGGAAKRENVGVHPERTLPPGVRRGGAGYRAMWPAGGTRSCQRAGGDAVGDRLGAASGEAPLPPLSCWKIHRGNLRKTDPTQTYTKMVYGNYPVQSRGLSSAGLRLATSCNHLAGDPTAPNRASNSRNDTRRC